MKKQHKYLLLSEILSAFIIFIIVSAACIPVFAKAVQYKLQSAELDKAVRICSSVMEICLSGNEDMIPRIYHGKKEETGWVIFLDKNFKPSSDYTYILKIETSVQKIYVTLYKNRTEKLYFLESVVS